jgi:hypothetical protein
LGNIWADACPDYVEVFEADVLHDAPGSSSASDIQTGWMEGGLEKRWKETYHPPPRGSPALSYED